MEWIKCEDRLPEEGEKVLTLSESPFEYKIDYIVHLDKNDYLWACQLVHEREKVRFWMPLPKPPTDKFLDF